MPSTSVQHTHVAVSRSLVAVNAASSVVARLVNVVGLIWIYQYLLARISVEEFALYPLVSALMLFAPLFFSFFTGGISRYVVASYARNDKDDVVVIVSSMLPVLALAGLAFLVCCGLLALNLERVFVIPENMLVSARVMLLLLATSFAIQMIALPFGTGYHVRQRFTELNLLLIVRDAAKLLLMYGFFVWLWPGVFWVVVATVVADIGCLAVVTARSRVFVPELRFRLTAVHWLRARAMVAFGMWTTLGRLAAILYVSSGTFLLNAAGTAADVTAYHLGAACFQHLQSMVGVARQPLQPALIAMHSLDDDRRLAATSLRGGRYGLWAALVVACPMAVFASDFAVLVLGEPFANVAVVIVLFMTTFFFSQPAGLLPMIAMARGDVRRFNQLALISSLICVSLLAALVFGPRLGALGAALAIAVGTAVTQVLFMWPLNLSLSKASVSEFGRRVLAPGLAPGLVATIVWLGLAARFRPIETWIELLVIAAPGVAIYVTTLALFCLDVDDRRMLRNALSSFRRLLPAKPNT